MWNLHVCFSFALASKETKRSKKLLSFLCLSKLLRIFDMSYYLWILDQPIIRDIKFSLMSILIESYNSNNPITLNTALSIYMYIKFPLFPYFESGWTKLQRKVRDTIKITNSRYLEILIKWLHLEILQLSTYKNIY